MAGGGSAWSDSIPLLDSSPHRDRFSVEMATAVPLEVPRRSVFLGVDVGTGSARAGLFDEDGKLLGSASSPIQIWKEGDCVEQSSTDIWHSICAAVKSACSLASVAGEEVTGLGFAATCSLGNGKDSTHGTTTESQYQVWIVQHLLVKEDDLKLLVELMKRISRVDGTCEWTNGNTRMPATYVAWTLCPSLHTCARMHPITVTLWDQFSEIEAAAMANLPGTFPVAIGMRLKMSNYHGIGLATRNSSICGDHLHDLIESYGLEENVHHREQNMAHPD